MTTNLLLYHQSPANSESTIKEHLKSFNKFSKGNFLELNTFYRPSSKFFRQKFDVIIFHYSIFGSYPFHLREEIVEFASKQDAVKIYFFQDEHQHHDKRIEIIQDIGYSQIYTLADQEFHELLFKSKLKGVDVYQTLTGFVGDYSIYKSYIKEFSDRTIDIFYRARNLPIYMGRGSQEKHEIGEYFLRREELSNLNLNISTDESDRVYGKEWFKHLGNSRFTLGTEAGVSIFDFTGKIYKPFIDEISKGVMTEGEAYSTHLEKHEGNIHYRTISPRIFEASSMKVCPIMFPGKYNNILIPNKNYICLEKDFSNLGEVISCMEDKKLVKEIIQNNFDLFFKSDEYTLKNFIKIFDDNLQTIFSEFGVSEEKSNFFQINYVSTSLIKYLYIKAINSNSAVLSFIKNFIKKFIK
tara:strand:+ start:121 stop:1353 length:1233 start_codon:yes stop_codon:yes gene_type:complete